MLCRCYYKCAAAMLCGMLWYAVLSPFRSALLFEVSFADDGEYKQSRRRTQMMELEFFSCSIERIIFNFCRPEISE